MIFALAFAWCALAAFLVVLWLRVNRIERQIGFRFFPKKQETK